MVIAYYAETVHGFAKSFCTYILNSIFSMRFVSILVYVKSFLIFNNHINKPISKIISIDFRDERKQWESYCKVQCYISLQEESCSPWLATLLSGSCPHSSSVIIYISFIYRVLNKANLVNQAQSQSRKHSTNLPKTNRFTAQPELLEGSVTLAVFMITIPDEGFYPYVNSVTRRESGKTMC